MVYFARACVDDGPIKIGSSSDLAARVVSLGTGCPWGVDLLYAFEGSRAIEAYLHDLFAEDRIRPNAEWFRPSSKLLRYIEHLKSGALQPVAPPPLPCAREGCGESVRGEDCFCSRRCRAMVARVELARRLLDGDRHAA